jgi:hypothetical protein
MEDFLILALCVAVAALIARLTSRGRQIERLKALLESMDRRVGWLETDLKRVAAEKHPAAEATPVHVVEPFRLQPTPNPVPEPIVRLQATPAIANQVQPNAMDAAHVAPIAPPPPPFAPRPLVQEQQSEPQEAKQDTPVPERKVSLEERLGQNWLNKLGIVTLVVGLALFLGYKLRTLGPVGKSATGMALALGLLAAGLLLERRAQYRLFARAAIGGGWALTFFVTFALYHVAAMQVLHSQGLDLMLMMAVAAAMVAHSLQYKSQVVTSLAFLLAFVTVGISEVTLFSLVAGLVLASGLIFVAARQRWFELALAGLVGVYVNHFLWLHRVLPNGGQPGHTFAAFLPSATLLLFYWLMFRLFYVLRVPETRRQELTGSLTAVLNSAGLMSLLKYQSSHPEWAFWGLLALGSAEMVLAFVARRRYRMGFIVLSSIASLLLLAAVPFRFSGSPWSGLWLLQAEMLFLVGVQMRETVFRRIGILAAFAATVQLIALDVSPIFSLRMQQPDATRHPAVALTLFSAAALFWFNAEFVPRRWSDVVAEELDRAALDVLSYVAAASALLALWVFFPAGWTAVAWLAAAMLLGLVADKLDSHALATQTDAMAVAALIRIASVNFEVDGHIGVLSMRAITISLSALLLYLQMRRKTPSAALQAKAIAAAYSWAASALLGTLLWYELQPVGVAVAWGIFGLILFELGLGTRRAYLQQQGYALLAASFLRIFFANLGLDRGTHLLSESVYTVVPLIAAYLWVYQRLTAKPDASLAEQRTANVAAWAGVIAATSLLYFEVRPVWVLLAWALLALVLIVLATVLHRTIFLLQSLALLFAAAVRALLFNLFIPRALSAGIVESRVFCVGAACVLMLVALPFAFRLRSRSVERQREDAYSQVLFRPEQPFFFVPLALTTLLLAVELRAGMITIGWSAQGVLVFLFALTVKERSYRLAGLALLLLGVAKILTVDIWHANPSDRYITLIVMGAALLSVSFLYSRYRETLLRFL